MDNISAFTEPTHPNPACMSLNKRDDKYVLSVRSRGAQVPSEIEMTPDQLEILAGDILYHQHKERA